MLIRGLMWIVFLAFVAGLVLGLYLGVHAGGAPNAAAVLVATVVRGGGPGV